MDHREDVAYPVIFVGLGIRPHRFDVVRVRQGMDVRIVVIHLTHLADMFPTAGLDQLIDRVVGIVGVRSDLRIGEEDRLLSGVLYRGDISRRVEGVGEILQIVVGISRRLEIDQAKRQRIVVVGCLDSVAVFDQLPLPFGVVVDVGDEARPLGGAAQPDLHLLQQVGFVIRRLDLTVVR